MNRRIQIHQVKSAAKRHGMNIVDESSGSGIYRAILTTPENYNINVYHIINIESSKEIGKVQFWCNVIDLIEEYSKRIKPCSTTQCDSWQDNHCTHWNKDATEEEIDFKRTLKSLKPNPKKFNPDPDYMRSLIKQSEMTVEQCADAIGVSAGTLRAYTVRSSLNKYQYLVQFAIECLIKINALQ